MLVTLMLVAPATTWLLVSTSPSGVSTMPVPAAAAPCSPSSVLMLTMAGLTFADTASTSSTVADAVGWPEKPKFWLPLAVGLFAEIRCPMPSPATTARAMATRVRVSARSGCRLRGGGWYAGCG